MMKLFKLLSAVVLLSSTMSSVYGEVPITTDSRIKTFVYNENEVYPLVVHFGYQSSIEFAQGEEAEVTSVGDSYAWKLSRVGRRLFIKTLEANAHTNLTVITNKRTYQFDMLSKMPDDQLDAELVYVVRFFYPEANQRFDKITMPTHVAPSSPAPSFSPQGEEVASAGR